VALLGERDRLGGDAAAMAARWAGEILPLSQDLAGETSLVVDAMFGAGLARSLEGVVRETALALNAAHTTVVAVDVPSGVQGDLARPIDGPEGVAVEADLTVTFFRKKPAHVLMPGRLWCGEVAVADIGILPAALETIRPRIFENNPALWSTGYPWPQPLAPQICAADTRSSSVDPPMRRAPPVLQRAPRCVRVPALSAWQVRSTPSQSTPLPSPL